MPAVTATESGKTIDIKGKTLAVVFDKATGTIASYTYLGQPLIEQGPTPNFRRAPLDNDVGSKMFVTCKPWYDASENRKLSLIHI